MDIDSIISMAHAEGILVVVRPDGSPAAKPQASKALMRILAAHRDDVIVAAKLGLFEPPKKEFDPFRCDACSSWVYDLDAAMVCENRFTCPLRKK